MKAQTRTIVASVAGAAVFAGLSYGIYRLFAKPGSTTSTTTTTTAPTACDNAAKLAKLAETSADPNAQLGPYRQWAALCTQQGGSPAPFPV
jgi:hypothetical protein